MLTLYTYYRSSAAYRVRIALELKKLKWQTIAVNLLHNEQQQGSYRRLNPQGLVPVLAITATDNDRAKSLLLTQSLAIIEYLEECYPEPPLLGESAGQRALIRSLAQQIAMDIHPLNNLRVQRYLKHPLALDEQSRQNWVQHWINEGFSALEQSLQQSGCHGKFCVANQLSVADVCLIPQVYNARRFQCDLTRFPLISAINQYCTSLPEFQRAAPELQPDCPAASDQ